MKKRGLLPKIPWDCLGIILDFTSKQDYGNLRVCKSITSQVNKRVISLTFSQANIPETTFASLLRKFGNRIRSFSVTCTLKQLKKSSFDKFPMRVGSLRHLDFIGTNLIGETAMSRFIDSCHQTLETFRVSYRSQALTNLTCVKLARC